MKTPVDVASAGMMQLRSQHRRSRRGDEAVEAGSPFLPPPYVGGYVPNTMRRLGYAILMGLLGACCQAASIAVSEVVDHGQPSYRIVTPGGTWIYQSEGAGFSSLIDSAGRDWLAYKPTGGAAGNFRGIPNAVFRQRQAGNNFFHPGHVGPKGSETTLVTTTGERVVLRSKSNDGRWECEWEILPDRAHFRMVRLPPEDRGYWFLYEGTPGGRFEPADLVLRPGGVLTPLSETWEASMKSTPWVAFISPGRGHALVLIAHDPPDVPVSYRPMENAMTVLGFGRKHGTLENVLTSPVTFTVALIAETDPAKIAAKAAELLRK